MSTAENLKEFAEFARGTAIKAGKLLLVKSKKRNTVKLKGRVNLVTDADVAAEKLIVSDIISKFPDHSILAEEGSDFEKDSDFKWVIDPLDGTTNFAHGFPFYCVSIGLEFKSKMVMGVIYDPERDELFYAFKNGGAFLNDEKISVSEETKLDRSLLATGFPYDIGTSRINNLEYFKKFARKARGVRRAGSAALDLCYLACGRFDGFWELKLHPWDTAAGIVIVEQAGGRISDFNGREYSIYGKYILATNKKIHQQMMKVIGS